jgi:hypothetical protein
MYWPSGCISEFVGSSRPIAEEPLSEIAKGLISTKHSKEKK